MFKFGHEHRRGHGGRGRPSEGRHAGRGRDGEFFGGRFGFGDLARGHMADMMRGGGRGGRRRLFSSDELRLVLLKLIGDQPRHGYDLIRAIEEQSGGSYAPSPGVVYPTITLLQDMEQIAERAAEGTKRQFAITDAGTALLAEKAEEIEALFARLAALAEESGATDRSPIRRAMVNLAMALRTRMQGGDAAPELAHDIAAILDETARRIERL
jgi:DNA-binding PadR family transcriptional regulator